MTRTHVDEFELIELQRKARSVFARVDSVAEFMNNRSHGRAQFSEAQLDSVEHAASLAREVSDAVDALTDYVRCSRMLD